MSLKYVEAPLLEPGWLVFRNNDHVCMTYVAVVTSTFGHIQSYTRPTKASYSGW